MITMVSRTWLRALLSVVVALNLGVGLAAVTSSAAFGQNAGCRVFSVGCHSVPVGCNSVPRDTGGPVGLRSRPVGCQSEPVGCNSIPFPDSGQLGRRSRPVGCQSPPSLCLPSLPTLLHVVVNLLRHLLLLAPPVLVASRPTPARC
jgi:hypothetical protein